MPWSPHVSLCLLVVALPHLLNCTSDHLKEHHEHHEHHLHDDHDEDHPSVHHHKDKEQHHHHHEHKEHDHHENTEQHHEHKEHHHHGAMQEHGGMHQEHRDLHGDPSHERHNHNHHDDHRSHHGGNKDAEHHHDHSHHDRHPHRQENHDDDHRDHQHAPHDDRSHGGARQKDAQPTRWAWAYASAAGMSVVSFVGVLSLVFLRTPTLGFLTTYLCLAFAGGVLCADACLHLLPHALEGADHDTMGLVGLAAFAGCLSLIILAEVCEWHQHTHGHDIKAYGIANLVVEMLHNFVDGLTLGLAFTAGAPAGFGATFAVALHELPQELGDFMVLREAGFPLGRLLAWNFLASLTCVGGVAVAHVVGEEASLQIQRYLMAFTAGIFLTLSLNMIIPQVLTVIHSRHEAKSAAATRAKLLCLAVVGVAAYALLKLGDLEGHPEHGHDHGHGGHGHGAYGHGEL